MLTAKKWLTVAALALCLLFGCAALADEAVKATLDQDVTEEAVAEEPAEEAEHVHKWTLKYTTATCTQAGERTETCECGETRTVLESALGHLVKPTLLKYGTLQLTCTRCGKEFRDVRLNGIEWLISEEEGGTDLCAGRGYHITKLVERSATCTEPGLTERLVCATCGKELVPGYTMGARGHWWSDWEVTRVGNCATPSVKQRTCRTCHIVEKKTYIDESLPHVWGRPTGVIVPTCCTRGYTGDYYCMRCGKLLAKGEWTCVDYTNHIGGYEIRGAVERTRTQAGYSGDKYCLGCGRMVELGHVLPILDY